MSRDRIVALILMVLLTTGILSNMKASTSALQEDIDRARLEHLVYWTGLIDEYHDKYGFYPLQDRLGPVHPALVRIATRSQQQYFDPQSPHYRAANDNNPEHTIPEFSMCDLVGALEKGLGRPIVEKYDIETVPSAGPNYYTYSIAPAGYALEVPCQSCGITEISLATQTGDTATVNIANPAMVPNTPRSLPRAMMLENPVFRRWMAHPYHDESYIRAREEQSLHDTKDR